mgnify:FL=1
MCVKKYFLILAIAALAMSLAGCGDFMSVGGGFGNGGSSQDDSMIYGAWRADSYHSGDNVNNDIDMLYVFAEAGIGLFTVGSYLEDGIYDESGTVNYRYSKESSTLAWKYVSDNGRWEYQKLEMDDSGDRFLLYSLDSGSDYWVFVRVKDSKNI